MVAKVARKQIKTSREVRSPETYLFDFDNWHEMSGNDFHRLRRNATMFYTDNFTPDDTKYLWKWMKAFGYSQKDIGAVRAQTQYPIVTLVVLAKLWYGGCPAYYVVHDEYWQSLPGTSGRVHSLYNDIKERVDRYIEAGRGRVTEHKEREIVPIRQRMMEQVQPLIADLEQTIDDFVVGDKQPDREAYRVIKGFEPAVKPNHAKIVRQSFEHYLEEITLLVGGKDEDLNQAYSHLGARKRKQLLKIVQDIMSACDKVIGERKPRKKK